MAAGVSSERCAGGQGDKGWSATGEEEKDCFGRRRQNEKDPPALVSPTSKQHQLPNSGDAILHGLLTLSATQDISRPILRRWPRQISQSRSHPLLEKHRQSSYAVRDTMQSRYTTLGLYTTTCPLTEGRAHESHFYVTSKVLKAA